MLPHKHGTLTLKESYAYPIHGPTEHNQGIVRCYENWDRLCLKSKNLLEIFFLQVICVA